MRHFSGEFDGVRLLMEDELDLIAGGDGEDGDENPTTTLPTVTVVGNRDNTKSYFMPNLFIWGGGGTGYGGPVPEPTDESAVRVDVKITRPLTADEQKAVDALVKSVQDTTNAVAAIPDNARVTLANGQSVTGAELKQIWAKTDIVVNEQGFTYRNGTTRGEADYAGGNPQVSFNIDNLTGYAANPGGTNYLPLHELGHMTNAGRTENERLANGQSTNDMNERVANDIAWAIASYSNMPILQNPGSGYDANHPGFR
ncbi:hypothetical protein [Massilia sp. YMA4]|uniref:hypothetical protein n=1 Tax=Massilia sp. YMA4 TaxID=1593482 RepID=UPI000DD11C1A|nr:hypothetical protein [Massilia sp. YMA4]AXA92728.1 hypothetical protein DPH57_17185 [Massilia sp. YMA4]